jgi:hypothetical protein
MIETLTTLPKTENSPLLLRRSRLIEKLEDQKSLLKDPAYVRVVQRWKKQDGERVLVERRLPVRPWWRMDEKAQVVFFVRLGWKPIEFEKGKAGSRCSNRRGPLAQWRRRGRRDRQRERNSLRDSCCEAAPSTVAGMSAMAC